MSRECDRLTRRKLPLENHQLDVESCAINLSCVSSRFRLQIWLHGRSHGEVSFFFVSPGDAVQQKETQKWSYESY